MAFGERKCPSLQNLDPFLSFWLDFCCCCCCCCRCCGCCYCYCSCCCLPSPYRAACATRGTRSGRRWPGDRGGNCPACLRPTPALSGMRAERCANAPARHVPVVTTGFPPGPCALASGCAWHGRLLSLKWKVAAGKLPSAARAKRWQVFTLSDWQGVWSFLRAILL